MDNISKKINKIHKKVKPTEIFGMYNTGIYMYESDDDDYYGHVDSYTDEYFRESCMVNKVHIDLSIFSEVSNIIERNVQRELVELPLIEYSDDVLGLL